MTGSNAARNGPADVDILLATYNGGAFLKAQIESLFQQTHGNWRVLARDDGSTDNTVEILRNYADRHPDRFILVEDAEGNLGYVANFARLIERSTARYIALCDQDDVWLPDKLTLCLTRLSEMETRHGADTPLLVHSDLKVVDRDLAPIGPSFWRSRGIDAEHGSSLNRLLSQNVATGCTAIFNRPVAALCNPMPEQAVAHDWWVALVAGAFGKIGHIAAPTILYRQHGRNTIGARSFLPRHLFRRAVEAISGIDAQGREFQDSYGQARAFLEQFADRLTEDQRTLLADFASFAQSNPIMLGYRALKWRLVPLRRVYWLMFALLLSVIGPRPKLKA